MDTRAPEPARLRFGVFEVELQTGELRRSGMLLHLAPQPFKVLAMLASRQGQLVTREEIRDQIWGRDTFVDFEHGLNVAIKEIRVALGDNAAAPKFIETLPRRGYRFLMPVEEIVPSASSSAPANNHSSDNTAVRGACSLDGTVAHSLQGKRSSGSIRVAIAVAATVLLLMVAGIVFNFGGVRSRVQASLRKGEGIPLKIQSIAVLPLENLSGDPEQEYFSDGLTDTLITDLGRIVTMRVISRASVMRYKHGKIPMPQIARELNVDAVVEGTVLRSGNKIRISVQLLDARSDRHLWADTYERDFVDAIQLERLLAIAIAHEISGRLSPAQEMQLDASRPINMRAYDAYLQGRHLLGERTEESETAAREYFTEALQADPNFALAYSGLADTYSVGWFLKLDLPRAEEYARKAIALGPQLAEGHASLGVAETYGVKLSDAGQELKRAIALNPNYAMAHHWYSMQQLFVGNLSEALAENSRARQLDPYSLPINFMRGLILFNSHEYDRAIEQYKFDSSINPTSAAPHVQISRIHWMRGMVSEALDEQRIVADLLHDSRIASDTEAESRVFAHEGTRAALLKAAELTEAGYWEARSRDSGPGGFYSADHMSAIYGVLQDRRKTLQWLNRYWEDDPGDFQMDRTAPEFDFIQSDPEYRALIHRTERR